MPETRWERRRGAVQGWVSPAAPGTSLLPRCSAGGAAAVVSGRGFSFPRGSFGFPGSVPLQSGDIGGALGPPAGFVWF